MKHCPACQKELADGAKFCASCGTKIEDTLPVSENPTPEKTAPAIVEPTAESPAAETSVFETVPESAPKKKGSFLKLGLILGGAVVALALVIGLVVGLVMNTPDRRFISIQEDLFVTPILDALENADKAKDEKVSTDMTMTVNAEAAENSYYSVPQEALDLINGASLTLKTEGNFENLVTNFDAVLDGESVLNGTLTVEGSKIGFCLPDVDDTYYVIDLSELDLSEDMDAGSMMTVSNLDLNTKEGRAIAERYLKILYTAVGKDDVKLERNQKVKLEEAGETVTCKVYTFTPNAENVEKMLLALADELENDKKLEKYFLDTFSEENFPEEMLEAMFDGENPEDYYRDMIDEAVEQLRDNAEDMAEEIEDADLTWTLAVQGKTVRMISILDDDDYGIVYECAGKVGKECEINLYSLSYGDYNGGFSLEYKREGKQLTGEASFSDGYQTLTLEFENMDLSKTSALGLPYGEYTLELTEGDISLSVVAGDKGSTDHVLCLDDAETLTDGMLEELTVNINTTKKSTASRPKGKSEDLTEYSMEELEEFFSDYSMDLSEQVSDVMEDLY